MWCQDYMIASASANKLFHVLMSDKKIDKMAKFSHLLSLWAMLDLGGFYSTWIGFFLGHLNMWPTWLQGTISRVPPHIHVLKLLWSYHCDFLQLYLTSVGNEKGLCYASVPNFPHPRCQSQSRRYLRNVQLGIFWIDENLWGKSGLSDKLVVTYLSQIRDIYDIVSVYVHVSFFYREKQTKSFKEGLVDGKEPPGHGWTGHRIIIIGGSWRNTKVHL